MKPPPSSRLQYSTKTTDHTALSIGLQVFASVLAVSFCGARDKCAHGVLGLNGRCRFDGSPAAQFALDLGRCPSLLGFWPEMKILNL